MNQKGMLRLIKKIFSLMTALMMLMTVKVFAAEDDSFNYASQQFNYGIICPKRPNVVPANIFYDDETKKGEVLIFENEGYNVIRGWVVIVDAFNTNAIPDFNRAPKNILEQYITELKKQGYDEMNLINITKDNKGIFAISAKEIEIDEDGDGKPDGVAISDHQEAITFFRTVDGRCFSIRLIGSAGLNDESVEEFKQALMTFRPTSAIIPTNEKSDKKSDKKSKKDKSDKKSKKDKK